MNRTLFALLIYACSATSLWAHEGDKPRESLSGLFEPWTLVEEPELVPCTLAGGAETTCFEITAMPEPADYAMGPWCPRTTSDTAEDAGLWLDGSAAYDVDGPFGENLASFYEDAEWLLLTDRRAPSRGGVRAVGSEGGLR